MSLYPPLRPDQLAHLNAEVAKISELGREVGEETNNVLTLDTPGDEAILMRRVSELRGLTQRLDLMLFGMYRKVEREWQSNVRTSIEPREPKPKPTIDSIMELI